jgi:hypothetical protein
MNKDKNIIKILGKLRNSRFGLAVIITTTLLSQRIEAANYAIDWLDMPAVVANGATINSGAIFNLPGYGNVQVSYTSTAPIIWKTNINPSAQNGNAPYGGDNYSWTTQSYMAGVNGNTGSLTQSYTITFNLLSGPVVGSQLVFGAVGLASGSGSGATNTSVTVGTNGIYYGDYDLGPASAPTQFVGGSGTFTMKNSVAAPTTGYFNTDFGLVKLSNNPTSIVLNVVQIAEDGIGFSLGRYSAVPEPSTAILALLVPLGLLRRKRPQT